MSSFPWERSFAALGDAITRLEEVVALTPDSNRIVIDATIQRFEFTFELCWKTLKRFLELEGFSPKTPKETIQKAFHIHWIDDERLWLQMMRDRNDTSHVYDETKAQEIYQRIKTYSPVFRKSYQLLERRKKGEKI